MIKMIKRSIFIPLLCIPFFLNAQKVDTSQVVELKKKAQFFANDLQRDSATAYYQKIAEIYKLNKLWDQYFEHALNSTFNLTLSKKSKKARKIILSLMQELEQHNDVHGVIKAGCHYQLGILKNDDEKHKLALNLFDKAISFLDTNRKTLKVRLGILMGKSSAYGNLGDEEESFQALNEGLGLLKKYYSDTALYARQNKARFYVNFNYNYINTRDFDKALEYANKALDIFKSLPRNKKLKTERKMILFNMALCYKNKRLYSKAIELYKQCLKTQDEINPNDVDEKGRDLLQLGRTYIVATKLDSAIFYISKSIEILRKKYKPENSSLANPYYSLGYVYTRQGKYALANQNYARALKSLKAKYGEINPNLVSLYNYMGANSYYSKKYLEVVKYQHYALMSNTRNFRDTNVFARPSLNDYYNVGFFFNSLRGKGMAFGKFSDNLNYLKLSLDHFKLTDAFLKRFRKGVIRKSDRILVGRYVYALIIDVIRTCEALHKKTGHKKYLEEAFYFAEREKASVLLNSITESEAKKFGDIPSNLLNQELKLRKDIARFQSRLTLGKGKNQQDSLAKANQAYEELTNCFEKDYPKYAQLKFDIKLATAAEIQTLLTPQTALLEYTLCRESIYLTVITKNKHQLIRIPKVKQVKALLNKYYEVIQGESNLSSFAPVSYQLYQKLVQPAEKHLDGVKKLIVIAPTLESTPFESLITKLPTNSNKDDFSSLSYLNNRFQISYHYSATLWQREFANKKYETQKQLDFIGFAPFSIGESKRYATSRGENDKLPESGLEVKAIYNLFNKKSLKAEVDLAQTATKESFIQNFNRARILHIASHSEANLKKPGLAMVRFAGCGSDKKDVSGCLLASEVYNLAMNTELLVLSSCSSGVGKLAKGEGIFSLARSFLYAGAHNVVFSLWDIDDQYTKELMVSFYENFLVQQQNPNYQRALQVARNRLIKQGIHPKHWAGIVMVGK